MRKEKEHRQHAHAWIDIEGKRTRKYATKLSQLQNKCRLNDYVKKKTRTEKIAEKGRAARDYMETEKSRKHYGV